MPTRDQVRKIVLQEVEKYSGGDSGPLVIAKALVEYYVKDITCYTNHVNDEEKIENVLEIISSNSLNIHFIYSDDNEFWIFQSIHRKKTTGLNPKEIKTFFDIHEKILDDIKGMNEQVGGLLDEFAERSRVNYVLLTSTVASKPNHDDFEELRDEKSTQFKDEDVRWELVDLEKIKSEYDKREEYDKSEEHDESELTSSKPIRVEILDIPEYIKLPTGSKNNKGYKSIVMILPGTVLSDWFSEHEDKLFSENIRGFLGNEPINKSITTTLANEGDMFYLYNNGISAICTKMEIKPNPSGKGERMIFTNFQVINGAQTVNSIHDFNEKDGLLKDDAQEKLEDVNVLVRITEVKVDETKENAWAKKLKRNMTNYNNSQNVVKNPDFRSNDLIQDILKAKFKEREIMYRATFPPLEVVYMPKRAYCLKKGRVVVYMDSMAKSLYAFKKKKSMVKINSTSNFLYDDSKDGEYWFLFGDENRNPVKEIDEDKFDEFAAILILNHFLESRLKEGRKGTKLDDIDGMVVRTGRLFLWAFGHVIREFYTDLEGEIYAKIIDGKAFESKPQTDRNSFIDIWYGHIHRSVHKLLIEEAKAEKVKAKKTKAGKLKIEEANRENVKTLNFKGWLRSEEKTGQLKDELNDIYEELCDQEKLPKIK